MTALRPPGDVTITDGGPLTLAGHAIWKRRGRVVRLGALDQPGEDLDYDEVVLHWADIAELEGAALYG